jgi:hypothetical protein
LIANEVTFFYNSQQTNRNFGGMAEISNAKPVNLSKIESVFDSALQKTSNLISNYMLQSPNKGGNTGPIAATTLSQRIDKILSNFDKLQDLSMAKGSETLDRREANLEAIRRVLQREAYFLDEERKWL